MNFFIDEKGNLNENYSEEIIKKKYPLNEIEEVTKLLNQYLKKEQKENYLEISHYFSLSYQVLLKEFKNATFLSDDPFESSLLYHYSKFDNKNIKILNYNFNYNRLSSLNLANSFDLIISNRGFSFEYLYALLPTVLTFLKVNGICAITIPRYWFKRDNLDDMENIIIGYSKQNDKKWVFAEDLENVINKNNSKLIEIKELSSKAVFTRLELAYLSSLEKLYDSIIKNNKAHIEICNIPERDISLKTAVIIIQKKEKSITKDTLFNL